MGVDQKLGGGRKGVMNSGINGGICEFTCVEKRKRTGEGPAWGRGGSKRDKGLVTVTKNVGKIKRDVESSCRGGGTLGGGGVLWCGGGVVGVWFCVEECDEVHEK